jgi:putative ABC transport system permease protein
MRELQRWLITLPLRVRSLFLGRTADAQLDEEFAYHLNRQTEENIQRGMRPDDAARAAIRVLGGMTQRKEACRDARGISPIEHALSDLRYGVRVLRKQPGFAAAVVATLALGIGATTSVFSVVYGVLLRPLPYSDPRRLVTIGHGPGFFSVGIANYLDWRAQNTVFDDIALTKLTQNFNITGDGEPERVLGGRTTASLFRVLRVEPLIGRVFTEADGQVEDKVVLSEGLWKRRYGGNPAILGTQIRLNGKPYTVLGVMAAAFQYRTREFALWTPLTLDALEGRAVFDYGAVARLKNGVTLAQAQAQMSEIQARIGRAYPSVQTLGMQLFPMLDQMVGSVRTPLYVLMGSVSCLLLIGAANLTNLLVIRAMRRGRELVVRTALGADKHRLVMQSVMELVPLVALGGVVGVMLANSLLALLTPLLPPTLPRIDEVRLDWRVLAFAAALLVAIAVGAGIWPALYVRRWNINRAMRDSGRTASTGGSVSRVRSALVVGQVAAVVVLLVVSTLLVRSFIAIQRVNPGFQTDNILAVHFALSEKYGSNPAFSQYLQRILERVSALPGVVSTGMVNRLPLAGQTQTGTLFFEGSTLPQDRGGTLGSVNLDWRTVTPEYFLTIGIPLVAGRFFDESDTEDRAGVGIVDERLARTVWRNQNPLGKRFKFGGNGQWFEVVGVVGHVRHDKLSLDERPQVYWTYKQRTQPRMSLAVRTQHDPNQLARSVIDAIHAVDPDQPVYDVHAMEDLRSRSMSQEWLTTMLLTLFASVALVLAMVGVYGVLSYTVNLRVREIGIRMALGSQRSGVVWMVLRQAGVLAGLGIAIGASAALLVGRVLTTMLFEVAPTDLLSFVAAATVLLLIAMAAAFVPARRAASVEPLSVLRAE